MLLSLIICLLTLTDIISEWLAQQSDLPLIKSNQGDIVQDDVFP